jgi:hypothetical protein
LKCLGWIFGKYSRFYCISIRGVKSRACAKDKLLVIIRSDAKGLAQSDHPANAICCQARGQEQAVASQASQAKGGVGLSSEAAGWLLAEAPGRILRVHKLKIAQIRTRQSSAGAPEPSERGDQRMKSVVERRGRLLLPRLTT